VLAAKLLLGEVGDIRRFTTKARFAAHTGTAPIEPIEASSGEVVRHRLSRAGNRKLNYALHIMALVQICHPSVGQTYYQRKLAEGKSPKEALRSLIGGVSRCGPVRAGSCSRYVSGGRPRCLATRWPV
jgi:transposase